MKVGLGSTRYLLLSVRAHGSRMATPAVKPSALPPVERAPAPVVVAAGSFANHTLTRSVIEEIFNDIVIQSMVSVSVWKGNYISRLSL